MAMNIRHFFWKMLYSEGVNPLPWKVIILLFFIMNFLTITMGMVYSFLPKMVKSFGVSEVNTGIYAGILASSIYVGFAILSLPWGYLGDVKSKKFSLIISSFGISIFTLAFGFSYNYYWAVVTRLLQGCFFGAAHLSKSILYEHLDDTNMALGMTIVLSSWTTGFIIGPSVGGLLVYPTVQYPGTFSKDSIFAKYPVLLPHLIIAAGLAISAVLAIFCLPNDKRKIDEERVPLLPSTDDNNAYIDETVDDIAHTFPLNISTDEVKGNRRRTHSDYGQYNRIARSLELSSSWPSSSDRLNNMKILAIFKEKRCMWVCAVFAAFGFVQIGFGELYPVFAATSIEYDGMGFTTADIGAVLLVTGICLLILQILILTKIINYLGATRAFFWFTLLQSLLLPLTPAAGLINNRTLLWIVTCSQMAIATIFVDASMISGNLLLSNSVSPDLIASANGLCFALTGFTRTLAPLAFGGLYSWSLTNVKGVASNKHALGFPFNTFFSFFVMAINVIIIAAGASRLPRSLDLKKDVTDKGKSQQGNENVVISNTLTRTI